MTTKTDTEQERAEFEAWAEKRGVWPRLTHQEIFSAGYQAGRAALQSQDREDALRYRWLRDGGNDDVGAVRGFVGIDCGSTSVAYTYEEGLSGEQLDEAIDHARRIEGGS